MSSHVRKNAVTYETTRRLEAILETRRKKRAEADDRATRKTIQPRRVLCRCGVSPWACRRKRRPPWDCSAVSLAILSGGSSPTPSHRSRPGCRRRINRCSPVCASGNPREKNHPTLVGRDRGDVRVSRARRYGVDVASRCMTPEWALTSRTSRHCSSRSTPRRRMVWEWVWRSAVRSSRSIGVRSGRSETRCGACRSTSRCREQARVSPETAGSSGSCSWWPDRTVWPGESK